MRMVTRDFNVGQPEAAVIIPVADSDDVVTKRCLDNLRENVRAPLRIFLESSGVDFAYGKRKKSGIHADSRLVN